MAEHVEVNDILRTGAIDRPDHDVTRLSSVFPDTRIQTDMPDALRLCRGAGTSPAADDHDIDISEHTDTDIP